MKHIDVRFHFVWKIFDEDDIKLQKIHTKENSTDMLTKVVPGVNVYIARSCSRFFQSLELDGAHLDELRMA